MTYTVLARRWRPRRFADLVGQEHVVQALTNGLEQNRLHHAFLFTGTRGVGKTTIARILAKSLNCETGVSAKPCGECATCQDIDQGRFVDLLEIDAASRTKVDDTREILDNVQYAPSRGRYKVYLIDEVHMLSLSSFNALLKTLEEPPPHVKFVLATTDPHKIPVTILSRCLRFNLRRLRPAEISTYLQHMLDSEQISWEDEGLALIARAADGSMRDGLSLLDQALAYGAGTLKAEDTQRMLGMVEQRHLQRILSALSQTDIAEMMMVAAELWDMGLPAERVLQDLARALHRMAVLQQVPDHEDPAGLEDAAARSLYQEFDPAALQLYYQITLHGLRDLDLAPDPRMALEMTLLRLAAFAPGEDALATVADSGPGSSSGSRPTQPDAKATATPERGAPVRAAVEQTAVRASSAAETTNQGVVATRRPNATANGRSAGIESARAALGMAPKAAPTQASTSASLPSARAPSERSHAATAADDGASSGEPEPAALRASELEVGDAGLNEPSVSEHALKNSLNSHATAVANRGPVPAVPDAPASTQQIKHEQAQPFDQRQPALTDKTISKTALPPLDTASAGVVQTRQTQAEVAHAKTVTRSKPAEIEKTTTLSPPWDESPPWDLYENAAAQNNTLDVTSNQLAHAIRPQEQAPPTTEHGAQAQQRASQQRASLGNRAEINSAKKVGSSSVNVPTPERPERLDSESLADSAARQHQVSRAPGETLGDNDAPWDELLKRLPITPITREFAANLLLEQRDGDCWRFAIPQNQTVLQTQRQEQNLVRALSTYFGRKLELRIRIQDGTLDTPAAAAAAQREAAKQAALDAVDADPVIQRLQERFDAVVIPGSIHPLDA